MGHAFPTSDASQVGDFLRAAPNEAGVGNGGHIERPSLDAPGLSEENSDVASQN